MTRINSSSATSELILVFFVERRQPSAHLAIGKISPKVVNHYGDEVLHVYEV